MATLKCPLCSVYYEMQPIVLPCGYSICSKHIRDNEEFDCSFCQNIHIQTQEQRFPVNNILMQMIIECNDAKKKVAKINDLLMEFNKGIDKDTINTLKNITNKLAFQKKIIFNEFQKALEQGSLLREIKAKLFTYIDNIENNDEFMQIKKEINDLDKFCTSNDYPGAEKLAEIEQKTSKIKKKLEELSANFRNLSFEFVPHHFQFEPLKIGSCHIYYGNNVELSSQLNALLSQSSSSSFSSCLEDEEQEIICNNATQDITQQDLPTLKQQISSIIEKMPENEFLNRIDPQFDDFAKSSSVDATTNTNILDNKLIDTNYHETEPDMILKLEELVVLPVPWLDECKLLLKNILEHPSYKLIGELNDIQASDLPVDLNNNSIINLKIIKSKIENEEYGQNLNDFNSDFKNFFDLRKRMNNQKSNVYDNLKILEDFYTKEIQNIIKAHGRDISSTVSLDSIRFEARSLDENPAQIPALITESENIPSTSNEANEENEAYTFDAGLISFISEAVSVPIDDKIEKISTNDIETLNYKKLFRIHAHATAIQASIFDRSFRYIFTLSKEAEIKIWSIENASLMQTLRLEDANIKINSIDVNFENTLLACGSSDKKITIWDLQTASQLMCLTNSRLAVDLVKFSPLCQNMNRFLVSTDTQANIYFWSWSIETKIFMRQEMAKFKENSGRRPKVIDIQFSMGGLLIYALLRDGSVCIYNTEKCTKISELSGYKAQYKFRLIRVDNSFNGFRFFGVFDNSIGLISCCLKRNEWIGKPLIPNLEIKNDQNKEIAFLTLSCDSTYLVTGTKNYMITIYKQLIDKSYLLDTEFHLSSILLIMKSHPKFDNILLTYGNDSKVLIFNMENDKLLKEIRIEMTFALHEVNDIVWSSSFDFYLTNANGEIFIYGLRQINEDDLENMDENSQYAATLNTQNATDTVFPNYESLEQCELVRKERYKNELSFLRIETRRKRSSLALTTNKNALNIVSEIKESKRPRLTCLGRKLEFCDNANSSGQSLNLVKDLIADFDSDENA